MLQFEQSAWLKTYNDFNTEKKISKSDSEKIFFKLMNNSVFGKTMENVRKRRNYEVDTDEKRRDKLVASPCFEQSIIIDDYIEIIKSKQAKEELMKPIYCGFATLELSKLLMYDFHYNVIKKQYKDKEKLLCTDTDSLC